MAREPSKMPETEAHRALSDLAPKSELREVETLLSRVPEDLHPVIEDAIRIPTDRLAKLLMGAAAAFYVREALRANSAVGLFPVGIVPGANCTPNVIYPLQPFTTGVTNGPYQFVTKQVFFDIMTSKVDADNGWQFASNSVRFSNDPLAGMAYGDTPFYNFEPEVVAGRDILGEYSHHEVIEQLTFYASAILYNAAAKPMVGPSIRFWDFRCEGEGINGHYFNIFSGPSFLDIVEDLLVKANGGVNIRDMFGDPNTQRRIRSAGRRG